jgi:hypothetical protein
MGEIESAGLEETALRSAGQRRVNILWEITQALIAVSVSATTLFVAATLAIRQDLMGAFLLLSNAFFLVVGFYFGRTNHQKSGGVGGNELGR